MIDHLQRSQKRVQLERAAKNPYLYRIAVLKVDRYIPPGIGVLNVFKLVSWSKLCAVPCGPMIKLLLCAATEPQHLWPELFNKED